MPPASNDDSGHLAPRNERVAAYLEATFDAIDEGVTIFDEQLRLVAWNRRYAEMDTGIHPDLVAYGVSLFDVYRDSAERGVFGPGDPDEIAQSYIDDARNRAVIAEELLTPNTGSVIRIRRFMLPNGGICATFRDVTQECEVEHRLRQSEKMEAIGRLTGGIAHDLSNILSIVLGNVELMQLTTAAQDIPGLDEVSDATQRGVVLIQRLLTFARGQPLDSERTDLAPLLEKTVDLLRTTIGARIELELEVAEGLWACRVDRSQLENAIINLVVNARDAIPANGSVCVVASNVRMQAPGGDVASDELDGSFVCISITDTGEGMDARTVERVFEPYFTTKQPGSGTGFGLSMVHGFVRQSGGQIHVTSELGEGTTFLVYLPREDEADE